MLVALVPVLVPVTLLVPVSSSSGSSSSSSTSSGSVSSSSGPWMDVTWNSPGRDIDQGCPRRLLLVVLMVVLETNIISLLNITDIMLRDSGKRNPAPGTCQVTSVPGPEELEPEPELVLELEMDPEELELAQEQES